MFVYLEGVPYKATIAVGPRDMRGGRGGLRKSLQSKLEAGRLLIER